MAWLNLGHTQLKYQKWPKYIKLSQMIFALNKWLIFMYLLATFIVQN